MKIDLEQEENEMNCLRTKTNEKAINKGEESFVADLGCIGNGHIVRKREMIKNQLNMKVKVSAFDGAAVTTNVVGEDEKLGRLVWVEGARNNLLNVIKLCNDIGGRYEGDGNEIIIYDKHNRIFAHAFLDQEGFLSFKYKDIYPEEIKANPVKEEQEDYFSNEERLRAQQAHKLCSQLGHPGDRSLMKSLENNIFNNCQLTGKDLNNARKLFGPCAECLLAKMRTPSDKTSKTPPAEEIGDKLFMDLIFYGHETIGQLVGSVFCVDEKSSYCCIAGIKNKEAKTIHAAVLKIVGHFNQYQHKVKHIVFDDENVLRAQKVLLNPIGIKITHTPAGLHNKRAERYIQTFKQRFEATKFSCEYVLPDLLDHTLAEFIVEMMNSGCNTVTGVSNPYQLVTGLKPFVPSWTWGQPGIFKSPKEDTHQKGEWGFFVGCEHDTSNHLKAWFPNQPGLYSRRKFVPHSAIPSGWNMKPRYKPVFQDIAGEEKYVRYARIEKPLPNINADIQTREPVLKTALPPLQHRKGDIVEAFKPDSDVDKGSKVTTDDIYQRCQFQMQQRRRLMTSRSQ